MTLLKSLAPNGLKSGLARFLVFVVIGCSTNYANAWSTTGHAQIAEAAFHQLSVAEQAYFEQQAAWLIKKERAKKWRKSLAAYSDFAKISVWPDTRRELTLKQLFSRFRTEVPAALAQFASHTTYRWHYVNAYYHPLQGADHCRLPVSGELIAVWPALLEAFQADNDAQRAVVLAFIVHLLADANQPLHTLAAVNKACDSDAGGNGFCLQRSGERCVLNLHQLWDRGFRVFDNPLHGVSSAKTNLASPRKPESLAHWYAYPEGIAKSSANLASPIYNLSADSLPASAYQQWAEQTVRRRAAQAAGDLTALLRELYEYTH